MSQGLCPTGQRGTSTSSVTEELADEIDKILADRTLGYRSRAEFIIEATRQRLMEVKKGSDRH